MKNLALVCALASFASASENLIEIYKNRTFLHQNFIDQKSSFSIKLPENINTKDIDVTASCDLKEMILGEAEPIKDSDYEKYEGYQKKLQALTNKLTALDKKFEFLTVTNRLKESGIDSLKQDSDKFYDAVLQNLNESQTIKEEINEIKLKLGGFKVKNIRSLNLSFQCDPKFVKVSYPITLSVNLQNQISADTAGSQIEIVQNLLIKSSLNYDVANLTINLYPFAYSSNLVPPPFYPWYEGKPEPTPMKSMMSAAAMQESASLDMAQESLKRTYNADVQSDNMQSTLANVWKISNVNLKANEESVFVYDRQSVDAKFDIVIDGYSGSNAYIRAKFTPNKSVETASTIFKIDGINVGRASNFSSDPSDESSVYFGKNELISVKKEKNSNFTKESFFGAKSKILESYNYTIKNNSKSIWNLTLLEKVPVSTHESVSVAIKNNPKENDVSKRGEVSWQFELKPSESKSIEFAYELTRPSR